MDRQSAASSDPSSTLAASTLAEHLQQITEALAAASSQEEVIEIVLKPALQALGAIAGAVMLIDTASETLRLAGTHGYTPGERAVWQDGPLNRGVPATDALMKREALYFEHSGALRAAYPELEQQTGGLAAEASAVLPMFLAERPLGVLVLDFREPHDFPPEERRFLLTLATQCAIALDRVRLSAHLERQVQERTAALDAFVRFTEAADNETEVLALAGKAVGVLSLLFPGSTNGYYELEDDRWKLRVHSDDLNDTPALLRLIQDGVPLETPVFAEARRTGAPVLVDSWDAEKEQFAMTEAYRAVGIYPLLMDGGVIAVFAIGLKAETLWSEMGRAIFLAVGRSLALALARTETARRLTQQNAELEARTRALEYFAALARDQETDVTKLVNQTQQYVYGLIGEGYAVYYELSGEFWHLRSQVGSPENPLIQEALKTPLPYKTVHNFRIPWESGAPYYLDVYDPAIDGGRPGTQAIASTAVLPLLVGTRRHGLFGYGLPVRRSWLRADKAALETAVSSLGLALERAEQSRAIEEERAALDAFARFTEAVGAESDVLALTREAISMLSARFSDASVGYYELQDGLWVARVWDGQIPPEIETQMKSGFPSDIPMIAQTLRVGDVVFTDAWDAAREQIEYSEPYGAVANYPLRVNGETRWMLSVGRRQITRWEERDKAVIRAVGRGLNLALERSEQTRQLRTQNTELEARTLALEGIAQLSHDLALIHDRKTLIQRAQQMVLSLLPPGYAAFYEVSGDRWRATVQVGDVGSKALQDVIDTGFPVGRTPSLDRPLETREPFFQDDYDRGLDLVAEVVDHLSSVSTLPVTVNGEVIGIFAVPLFDRHPWNAADRALLVTTVRSLGLVIEGAQNVAQLDEERRILALTNEELEAFAYSASHDLRTPVRHVMSFADLARKALHTTPNEKASSYLDVVQQSAVRMTTLIDAILLLSRAGRQEPALRPVDLAGLVTQAQRDARAEFPELTVNWLTQPLPVVRGDLGMLQQVMTNLLSNALKFSSVREVSQISIWAEERKTEWVIFVRDNGVGFDPRYQQKLFGVFQRLHSEKDFQGTGVGLATVRRVVMKHGGRVFAESQPGHGATFGFTLPKSV